MQIILTITCVLLLVSIVALALLWRQRTGLLLERDEGERQNESLRDELNGLRTEIELTKQQQGHAEKLLTASHDHFKAVAGEVLKHSQDQFLQLAEQRLKTEQAAGLEQIESRKKEIEKLVQPVKETLEKYNVSLQEIEKARTGAYESLTKDLELFRADQRRLREETGNLVKALRRPEVRGRWGEMQLRRVVELAGMIEHCDYQEQTTVVGQEGRLRPDMVVRLPSERCIVIDAKTPIDAFIDSLECTDDAAREVCLDRHADQIENKVRELAGKGYQQQFERAPDFVVLFIPGESFLQPAVERRPKLMETAMEKGVVIATPGTLIALLRTVAIGWREERLAENAQMISNQGRELHERLCVMAHHLSTVGASLGKAVENYNTFIRSLDSRVMPSIRKLEDLHAKSAKDLPELPEIEVNPQPSRALLASMEVVDGR